MFHQLLSARATVDALQLAGAAAYLLGFLAAVEGALSKLFY